MATSEETPAPAWNPAEVYKTNDPRGWCGDPGRGAAMGRCDIREVPEDYDLEFTIRIERILLIEGYDPNGTYFGIGAPLFWVYAQEDVESTASDAAPTLFDFETATLDYVERFVDIEDAVRIVQETWPRAKVVASEAWCDELVEKYMDEEYAREQEEYNVEYADDTTLLQDCAIKPPSMPYEKWTALIDRHAAARRVCELLAAHQPTYDESGYFDTTCLPELFRLAASAIDPE